MTAAHRVLVTDTLAESGLAILRAASDVDVDACTERGILVINAPTANILSATEHTMAMLLALCRNIPEAHASVKRGEWVRSKFLGLELSGKTLGVIGLGRIGTRVTTRARAFGMTRVPIRPSPITPSVFPLSSRPRN